MGVIYVPVSRTLFWGHTEAFNGQIAAWRCEVDETGSLVGQTALPLNDDAERPYIVVASRSHLSPETEAFVAREREAHPGLELHSAGSSLKYASWLKAAPTSIRASPPPWNGTRLPDTPLPSVLAAKW